MLGEMIEQIAGQADEIGKLREAVAERDALLRECLSLYELGWNHYEDKALFRPERGEDWKREADEIHARITAMIGE